MEEQGAAQKCPRAGGLELQGRGHVLGQNVTGHLTGHGESLSCTQGGPGVGDGVAGSLFPSPLGSSAKKQGGAKTKTMGSPVSSTPMLCF